MGGPLNSGLSARLPRILAVASIVTLLVLSGCAGKSKSANAIAPSDSGPAGFSDETGAVEGLVQSEEFLPLAGATVGIPDLGVSATSDGSGRYVLSNLQPGDYLIHASLLGYSSNALSVSILAGEATSGVDLTLTQIQLPNAAGKWSHTDRGMFGCGGSIRATDVSPGANACSGASLTDETSAYNKNTIVWESPRDPKEITALVFEMQWNSNQALGKGLSLSFEVNGCSNSDGGEGLFFDLVGNSPIRVYMTGEQVQKVLGDGSDKHCTFLEPDDSPKECVPGVAPCKLISRVFAGSATVGESNPADVGVTVQQDFTHYITLFYGQLPKDVETYTHLAA